jgi:hypothetical protein
MEEELLESFKRNGYLTVAELREILPLIEDQNSLILVQRIEDKYYNEHNWKTIDRMDEGNISQYSPVWCRVNYNDGKLFLNLHY